ncbi:platelet-activating factor acetylhydrolase, isoform II domain-containing protein [Hirsutella rhossiliensis]|uniref:Platelet-activating factor acetylhydrolase, isoform II domain-containing protein n=1 Tax=Hirsutella rhossiliensis TaxID=111463 RepID=A0A9P8MMW2_9HYPO|nr:platelet-activating factor acetylhydrolase, isoform II domain-containing protein [Hirsutella rhossiliensis]KAH0958298.1 platelet-activating factor acetylhydrolase, isoform II domain-containing protein [Hirsutella rhossiliensis]
MPPDIASIEDAVLDAYLGSVGWPEGILSSLELALCCKVHRRHSPSQRFPKLLYGTGLNISRLFYSAMAQHLASMGFEVIAMDHLYETDVVQFANGELVFRGRIGRDSGDDDAKARGLDVDASFVMDFSTFKWLSTSPNPAMLSKPSILGGVNLDGELWGGVRKLGVSRPFLFMGAEDHNTTSFPGWSEFCKAM